MSSIETIKGAFPSELEPIFQELKPHEWKVFYTAGETLDAHYVFLITENTERILCNISQIAAVSIVQMLEQYYQVPSTIKWPNCVLVNRKEVASILIETATIQRIASSYGLCLEIRINVNSEEAELEQLKRPVVSLKAATQKTYNIDEIIGRLSTILQENIAKLTKENYIVFQKTVQKYLEPFEDLPIVLATKKESQTAAGAADSCSSYQVGLILGVNDQGDLILKTKKKEEEEEKIFTQGKILCGEEIQPALTEETLEKLIGRKHYKKPGSTQTMAGRLTRPSRLPPNWCYVVTAEEQEFGEGSKSYTSWHSPKGNFYATFIFPKKMFPVKESGIEEKKTRHLYQVVTLSIAQVLNGKYGVPVEIEGNDVTTATEDWKKLSGIYIEFKELYILIGIGINVNIHPGAIVTEQKTTSMKEELSLEEDLDVEEILFELEKQLYLNLELFKIYGISKLIPEINKVLRPQGKDSKAPAGELRTSGDHLT